MSRTSGIGLPALLFLAGAGVALALVHFVVYLVRLGASPTLMMVISTGSHRYWPAFAVGTLMVAAGAVLQTRHRLQRAPSRPSGSTALGRRILGVWLALVTLSIVGLMVIENAEVLISSGRSVGLAPLTWLTQPVAALGAAASLAAIAAGIVFVTQVRTNGYSTTLVRSYRGLVETGTYSSVSGQSAWARDFVADVLEPALAPTGARPLSILECGSGTGVWLSHISALTVGRDVTIRGFDLSPDMVEGARERLARRGEAADVHVGDILDPAAYDFGETARHDVVYAFDVIQQLPADLQARAVSAMFHHLAPGGWLVVFDHDRRSRYGRVMGLKKWLRRHFDLPLVPRFYIHARYPDLRTLQGVVEGMGAKDVSVRIERQGRKRALVARRADR